MRQLRHHAPCDHWNATLAAVGVTYAWKRRISQAVSASPEKPTCGKAEGWVEGGKHSAHSDAVS